MIVYHEFDVVVLSVNFRSVVWQQTFHWLTVKVKPGTDWFCWLCVDKQLNVRLTVYCFTQSKYHLGVCSLTTIRSQCFHKQFLAQGPGQTSVSVSLSSALGYIVYTSCLTLRAMLGPAYKQSVKESCLCSCGIIKLDTTEKPVSPPPAGSRPGLVAPPECRFSVLSTKVEQNFKFHDGGTWGTWYEHEWCFVIRLLGIMLVKFWTRWTCPQWRRQNWKMSPVCWWRILS